MTLFCLVSCNDLVKGKGLADAAIVDFHLQFNEGNFKKLYAAGHQELKASATEEDFVKLLEAVHRKLGKYVKDGDGSWRVNTVNFKTVVSVSRKAEFEHGKGTETFSFIVSGESCLLLSYYIQSNDMLVK
ncbi:hypothetical protein [Prosthecobacter vanneervenii]|uniref:Uncharacterized protein n=1 Tax=Prosthecobacter vanneervenii TaxID=48466 RepID=A0A7W7Y7J6_9BACT|nr:hypothetical protein [Prosthecobacter vanneervenii]MBB5030925.1 hypothetical protein [Prosthecobacter vanneervenii]